MANAVGCHEIGVWRVGRDVVQHSLGLSGVPVSVGTGTKNGLSVKPNFIQKGREEHFSVCQRLLVRFESALGT